jgi:hypothetical protein
MKSKKNLLCLAVMAFLLGWTVYTVLQEQTPREIVQALASADWKFLLLALALMLAFLCCEAKATHRVLQALGTPQPYRNCYFYSCAGFCFSNITPSATGGQPAQVYYMNRDGVPVVSGTLDMLLVTIGYQTAAVAFGVLALATCRDLPEMLGGRVGFLLGLGFAIYLALDGVMLLFLFLPDMAQRLGGWLICLAVRAKPSLNREALEDKFGAQLTRYRQGAALIRSAPGLLPRVLLLSACQLACSYAVPYCVYLSFHLTGVTFWEAFSLQVLCTMAVGYLPLPGSAGAAENVFLRAFVLMFGADLVAPAMIASRTVSCYLVLLVTAVITAVGHAVRPRRAAQPQTVQAQDRAA